MKLFSILMLVPFFAFGETCFVAEKPVPDLVPASFCVSSIEEGMRDELKMITNSNKLPKDLLISDRQYMSEEKFRFVANAPEMKHMEQWCGYEVNVKLIVNGVSRFSQIETEDLKFSIEVSESLDNCHSRFETTVINYRKI